MKLWTKTAFAALTFALAPPLAAHGPQMRQTISIGMADTLIEESAAEAKRRGVALVIVVVDEQGDIVALRRMDGALPHSVDIALGKARTAALTRQPSRATAEAVAAGRTGILSIDGMMPFAGGLPVTFDGKLIGAVAASGSPADIDEAAVAAGVAALEAHIAEAKGRD